MKVITKFNSKNPVPQAGGITEMIINQKTLLTATLTPFSPYKVVPKMAGGNPPSLLKAPK